MGIVIADVFLNFSRFSNAALTICGRNLTGDIFVRQVPE